MRIYYRLLGGHYHCRVFMNGKCGELVVGEKDWLTFQMSFSNYVTWTQEAEIE